MVLDAKHFRKAIDARAPHIDLPCEELGGTVRLKRLTAAAGIKLGRRYNAVPKGPDGQPKSDEDMADFFVWLLSMSIVDDKGEQFLCHDDGRQQLARLSLGSLSALGSQAMILNGMAEEKGAKKNAGTSREKKSNSPST